MATNLDITVSSPTHLTQNTPEPPPRSDSLSVPSGGNKNSISSFMQNDHRKEQLSGDFANTQNPAMKFSLSSLNPKNSDVSGGNDNTTVAKTPDPYQDYNDETESTVNAKSISYKRTPSIGDQRDNDNTGQLRLVPNQHLADNTANPLLRDQPQNSLANRAVVNARPTPKTYPKSKAVVGVIAGGAAGAASGAVIAGGVAGLSALGAAVTGGLIGAAAGSTVPVVGTIIGAAVGVTLGIAWAIRAKAKQADLLDTTTRSTARTFQRSPFFAWARALDPMKLIRGIGRKIPLISGRRALFHRARAEYKNCREPISETQMVKWEESGQDATVADAKGALRYAVASQMSYMTRDNFTRTDMGSSEDFESYARSQKDGAENSVRLFGTKAAKQQAQRYKDMDSAYTNGMSHGTGQGWDFQPISPNSTAQGGIGKAIFDRLPPALQNSLGLDGSFHDPDTGNRIMLHYDVKNKEVVIAYAGTGASSDHRGTYINQELGNLSNYLGGVPPSIDQVVEFGKAVREAVADYNQGQDDAGQLEVVSTGHSRGGMQAQVDVLLNGGRAETFNPEPMGGGLREYCGILRSNRLPHGVQITNHSVADEFVSGNSTASAFGNAYETVLGLPAPFIPGDRIVYARAPGAKGKHGNPITHTAYRAGGGDPPKRWFGPKAPDDPSTAPLGVPNVPDVASGIDAGLGLLRS